MLSGRGLAKCSRGTFEAVRCVLDTVDEIVGVLALEALIEREGLQAREAHEIRVPDGLRGNSTAPEQFGADFGYFGRD